MAGTGTRRAASSQNLLVVTQVALSMILLFGSGLLIRSFLQLINANPGFDPTNILTMRMNLPPSKYGTNAQMVSFYNEVLRQMQSLPGVSAAAISSLRGCIVSIRPAMKQSLPVAHRSLFFRDFQKLEIRMYRRLGTIIFAKSRQSRHRRKITSRLRSLRRFHGLSAHPPGTQHELHRESPAE
jgi:hypothetical protein